MKKKYDSPSVQKVSFRYRDQVVAASGIPTVPGEPSASSNSWIDEILNRLPSGPIKDIISGFIDWLG